LRWRRSCVCSLSQWCSTLAFAVMQGYGGNRRIRLLNGSNQFGFEFGRVGAVDLRSRMSRKVCHFEQGVHGRYLHTILRDASDQFKMWSMGAYVEVERLVCRTSGCDHFTAPGIQRPGSELTGLSGLRAARCRAEACKSVSSPNRTLFTRSVKESGSANPGHGKGPPCDSAGSAGLTVLREGRQPVRCETLGH
jgi:hypothetical protein